MKINHLYLSDSNIKALGKNIFRKQILKIGEWVHPNNPAKKLRITKDLIRQLIANFNAGVLDNVPVPDTHTSSAVANTGYVIGLEETDDGLDAIMEIRDEKVAEKIKQGLIPGVSASFTTNYIDKKSGKSVGAVLFHSALVDNPYLKGMRGFEPVSLSDEEQNAEHTPFILSEKGDKNTVTKDELLKMLKEEHNIDVVELSERVKKLESVEKDLTTAKETLDSINDTIGDTVELSDASIVDKVKAIVEKVTESETETVKLSERIESLEKSLRERDAKDAVRSLIAEGKLLPKQQEAFEKLYLSDKSTFDAVTSTLEPRIELGERGIDTSKTPKNDELDDDAIEAEIERLAKLN